MAHSNTTRLKSLGSKLSKSTSQNNFVEGAIVRIRVENFLTYDSVEFKPGSKLNVIIGPNGTGKSTIVCAICLGLGGKTNFVGRATQISEYIKHGCTKAMIEIELYKQSSDNVVIFREIHRDNSSAWLLNGKQCTQKAIEDMMDQFNIQVGNLCQFLPQDRVADFVKMTQQDLLINTEKAVGSADMYSNHMELKQLRINLRDLEHTYENTVEHLKKEQVKNSRLEEEVKNFHERQNHLETIELLQKKKPWVEYDEARKKYSYMKNEHSIMTQEFKKLQQKYAPLQKELSNHKEKLQKIDSKICSIGKNILEMNQKSLEKRKLMEKHSDKVSELQEEFTGKKSIELQRRQRLQGLRNQLQSLKNELSSLPDDDTKIQSDIEVVNKRISVFANKQVKIETEIENSKADIINIQQEIKRIEQELKQVQDTQIRRLELLRQKNKHAYDAVMWLKENNKRFKKKIYEPIMVLVNVQDPKMAIYIEAHIPFKDLFVFVCEDVDDMEEFLQILRDQRHLQINVALVPARSLSDYKPRTPITNLERWDFRCYLKDLIVAPDPVLRYLCQYHKIHDIPIGSSKTKENIEKVIKETGLNNFYTEKHHYIAKKSKYNNQISVRNQELLRPSLLTVSVDVERVNNLTTSLKKLKEDYPIKAEASKALKAQHNEVTEELEQLRVKKKELTVKRDMRKNILAKISQKEESIRRCEHEAVDLDSEEEKTKKSIQEVIYKKCAMLCDYIEKCKEYFNLHKEKINQSVQKANVLRDLAKAEENYQKNQGELEEYEENLTALGNEVKEIKESAKRLLNNARKVTGINVDSELSPELKTLFAKIPDTITEIDAMIHDVQAQADCLLQTDENIIHEYHKRKKEIAQLEKTSEEKKVQLEKYKTDIERIKQIWLPSLEELIQRINQNFSRFFRSLGCAGEISINKSGNEEDFDKYGICIKVKYRDSEQLKELSPYQQSGGERSVATVLYMMALQELTHVPFRCVDEINQGMDSINERKVFDLMVQMSCQENTSQYFLLTPKLLPDLEYSSNMTILCVYNGTILNHKQWNMTKFCARRRCLET